MLLKRREYSVSAVAQVTILVSVAAINANVHAGQASGERFSELLTAERAAEVSDLIEALHYEADDLPWFSDQTHLDTDLPLNSINVGMLQDEPPPDAADPTAAPASGAAGAPGGASSADELSKKLANPISSLISIPLQSNFVFGGGPDNDGFRYTLNVQPVIPLSLGENWNLIIRTIVPITYQDDLIFDSDWDQFGLGDTVQSFFFSPKEPGPWGMTWGVGPVFLWPTATNDSLGSEKWGAGPTGVFLFQSGPWTYGALANHIWSYAGEDDRRDINATFIQPFVSYQFGGGWSASFNTESTYDWDAGQWTVPLYAQVAKVMSVGGQMMSFAAGFQWFAEAPEGGPEWAFRFVITFLFPA